MLQSVRLGYVGVQKKPTKKTHEEVNVKDDRQNKLLTQGLKTISRNKLNFSNFMN